MCSIKLVRILGDPTRLFWVRVMLVRKSARVAGGWQLSGVTRLQSGLRPSHFFNSVY
jgi:hypothetical protein